MGYIIKMAGAILSMCDVDFKCPKCGFEHTEKDYYNQLIKSKTGLIYKKCKGCSVKIGITSDITGDVVVWLKETEKLN